VARHAVCDHRVVFDDQDPTHAAYDNAAAPSLRVSNW
jgi:hypothetical protein